MRINRHRRIQRFEDVDLARRVVDMIFAADHVSDRHIPVIYHHAEVIGRGTIGTANDQIVQFPVAELDRSADLIVKNNRTFLRVGETHDARLIISMVLVAMAAAAIVTRLLTLRHLLFAQRFQTFFRAIAFVSGTGFQHLIDYVVITIETFGLEIGPSSHCRFSQFMPSMMASIASGVERSRSVSSIRSTNSPPWLRAKAVNREQYAHRQRADSRLGLARSEF